MRRKKLIVISHTEHFRTSDGEVRGWGSTVTELNYLGNYWDEVVHFACVYDEPCPANALPYNRENIRLIPIPRFGGKSVLAKLKIAITVLKIIRQIKPELKDATDVQLRLPTGIGIFLVPWFSFQSKPYAFWMKYAGNWKQTNAPLGYRIQRWMLKKRFHKGKVTINGNWSDQPKHCYTFENPCLSQSDIDHGSEVIDNKVFEGKTKVCFVGRIAANKGINKIIELIRNLDAMKNKQYEFHFVGDGPLLADLIRLKSEVKIPIITHGFLDREQTFGIYANCHLILLPSDSEGFPKVIAEAVNFGCIPMVSDVSCIGQYVTPDIGYLYDINTSFSDTFINTDLSLNKLKTKVDRERKLRDKFTYHSYYRKLEKFILSDKIK